MSRHSRELAASFCLALSSAALVAAAACHRGPPPVEAEAVPAGLPSLPQHEIAAPTLSMSRANPLSSTPTQSRDTAAEAHVTIDTHGADVDVRQVLAFLADKGRMSLVYSPDVNRKVRVQLVDVPVSEALAAVLSLARLTLESTTGIAAPATPSVVFYQLPVNVDSLSVDAIMKRFDVGRTVAEMIVESRRVNRP